DLAPVRRDVVVVRGRVGARDLVARAGEEVLHAARVDVDREEPRHAPVGEPAVPPPVRGILDDMRLDLVVLPLLVALRDRGERALLRPYPREERDAARVREPLGAEDAGGDRRDAPRLAAVRRDEIELRLVVALFRSHRRALGDARDPATVGRPARLRGLFARGGGAPT